MTADVLSPDNLFLGDNLQEFYAFTEPWISGKLRRGDRMLDVGCGDGKLAMRLSKVVGLGEVVGFDVRETAIGMARSRAAGANMQFVHRDAQDFDTVRALGTFDVVLARTSLHHFRDPIAALKEYSSILNTGGRLLLVDIDRESACCSILGFPVTLLITWVTVLRTLGWRRGWTAIRGMKYPSREWREHRMVDVAHRKKTGWYRFSDIKAKIRAAFPGAEVDRLASWGGLGGVHCMAYTKPQDG